ncbi:MAG TPA: MEDS domain-containing protein [Terracidiphilus sp.]|nr:MEDS domain-containing protein [Terracidiphilus sp.]
MNSFLPRIKAPTSASAQIFWGEIAPSEHVAQFYENENVLLDALTGYVSGGIKADECAIVIATPEHRAELHKRLREAGVDVWRAQTENRYISLDAETTLARFMVDRLPDEKLFTDCVASLLQQATADGRRVRAFGEMVALLWARGEAAATVRLEFLWQAFCQSHAFSLFCAYPKAGLTDDPTRSLAHICAAHSRVV